MKGRCVWTALVLPVLVVGCGTLCNVTSSNPDPRVYGGIRQEWSDLKVMRFDDVYCINLLLAPWLVADLPLSVLGDTLTLPYVLGRQVISALAGSERPEDKPSATPVEPGP
jgi:uncharacterized protein YceK